MCHPDAPSNPSPAPAVRREVRVPLAGGEELPALLAGPDGDAPGVLVFPDIYGRTPFYEDLAARLATAGFHALLTEPFFRQGPLANPEARAARRAKLDDLLALADHSTAIDWLRGRPGVVGERVGTVGFCMGGTFVLNLAAERDDLATVCYYGFPRRRAELPASPNPAPAPLEQLDRVNGPVLGFWGDQDATVGMDAVAALAGGLAARGVDFEHTVYPGIGHSFLALGLDSDDSPAHGPAVESWQRALAFWRRHLGAPAG